MKATRIGAKDFLAHREMSLELPKKISVFVARNGEGKSSILDMVRAGLTGTARGVARKDARDLARWGSTSWWVEILLEHGDATAHLRRTSTKLYAVDDEGVKHDIPQNRIESVLANGKTLAAVFDVWRALEMTPNERRAMVFDLSGSEVDGEMLEAEGIRDPEVVEAILDGKWKRAETIAAEKKRAYNRRIEAGAAKRPEDVEVSGVKVSTITDEVLQTSRNALEGLRETRVNLIKRIGAAEANSASAARLELLKSQSVGVAVGPIRQSVEDIEKVIAGHIECLAAVDVGDLRMKAREAKSNLSQLREQFTVGGNCSQCGQALPKQTPPDNLKEVLEKAETDAKSAEEVSRQAKAYEDEQADGKRRAENQLIAARQELSNATSMFDEIQRLEGAKVEDPTELKAELVKVESRIDLGNSIVDAVDKYRAGMDLADQSALEIENLLVHSRAYAEIEQKCKPDGLPAKLLGNPLEDVVNRMAVVSRLVFPEGGQILGATLSEDFEPLVVDSNGELRSIKTLNPGARWRVGFCLADALAQLSGLRFLALDEVSMLDADARADLIIALLAIEEDYDQIVIASVMGDVNPAAAPADLPIQIYTINDGRIKRAGEGDSNER